MLVTPATSKRTRPPRIVGDTTSAASTLPPVITPTARHPVYGATPIGRDGFTLERQSIFMLDAWHSKATVICLNRQTNDDEFAIAHAAQCDIYRAAIQAKITSGSEVALQLGLMLRHFGAIEGSGSVVLDLAEFSKVFQSANAATAPLRPKKIVPPFTKGRKLTRAGLLFRYHAFLIGELETLSWNLYGSRDYAMQMRPGCGAVEERCRPSKGRGKRSIFFDESKLTSRARAVFKSLKIEAVNADRSR